MTSDKSTVYIVQVDLTGWYCVTLHTHHARTSNYLIFFKCQYNPNQVESAKIAVYSQIILSSRTENVKTEIKLLIKTADKAQQRYNEAYQQLSDRIELL